MKLSILIPVYNERRTLREIVSRVMAQQIPGIEALELVIVDDYSTDGTREILAELAAEYPDTIQVILLEQNQGKGNAISTAIQAATGDLGIIQDADLEYDPGEYAAVLQPILEGAAMWSTAPALPTIRSGGCSISATPSPTSS